MEQRLLHRNVLVLVEQLYEDLELWYPVLRLREEGATVLIAGAGTSTYHGKHGYPVTADMRIEDVQVKDFDAVIIPGGYAPDHLRRNPLTLSLVREMMEQEKVIGTICHAAWVAISAGIVKDKQMTCFHSIKDDLINAGAQYSDTEVIRDGFLISSRQPSDLGMFCREIIEVLSEKTTTKP
ncbi:type 1 glutamine amidotransferase domain-containing protein [Candidatus Nitrospira salsa]|nr:MAG: protease [Nitrospirales bacterium]